VPRARCGVIAEPGEVGKLEYGDVGIEQFPPDDDRQLNGKSGYYEMQQIMINRSDDVSHSALEWSTAAPCQGRQY